MTRACPQRRGGHCAPGSVPVPRPGPGAARGLRRLRAPPPEGSAALGSAARGRPAPAHPGKGHARVQRRVLSRSRCPLSPARAERLLGRWQRRPGAVRMLPGSTATGGINNRPFVWAREEGRSDSSRAGAQGAVSPCPAPTFPRGELGAVPRVPGAAAAAECPEPVRQCQASVWLQYPLWKCFYSQEIEVMLLNI